MRRLGFLRHQVSASVKQRLGDITAPLGTEDELAVDFPPPAQMQWRINPRAALVLGFVVAMGAVIVVAWNLISGSSRTVPVSVAAAHSLLPAQQPVSGAGDPAAGTQANGDVAASTSIVVSVVGEVEQPGLITLAPNARVADALDNAGLKPQAATLGLNLAQKLVDGEQILVPHVDDPAAAIAQPMVGGGASTSGVVGGATGGGARGKLSINRATATELTTLSGVGEKTAQAIVAYRESHGGFSTIEQLQEVKGIGPAKFSALAEEVTL